MNRSSDESIRDNRAPVLKNTVSDHGSKTIAVIALVVGSVMGSVAIGAIFMYAMLAPQVTRAQIEAGNAEALVIAKVARTDARVALDDVQRLREALTAKGSNVQKEH